MSGPDENGGAMLPTALDDWLRASAETLDQDASLADQVPPRLAQARLFGIGVPSRHDGDDRPLRDAVQAIAAISARSLTAGFVFWGQRAFIEYLLRSPNAGLRDRWLPALLAGEQAGATGLSNAMKHLSGIEALQVTASAAGDRWTLAGRLPWATNLRPGRFIVAAAIDNPGQAPFVAALPADRPGVVRSDDLDLIALRGSRTASVTLDGVAIDRDDLIHDDARDYLPRVRPAFLGLQCGLSIGLARAALDAAQQFAGASRAVLDEPIADTWRELDETTDALLGGLDDGRFVAQARELFALRIRLAGIVQQAVSLELQAGGGRAYHRDSPLTFARHWREAAFIPIVTPSLTQLHGELRKPAPAAPR